MGKAIGGQAQEPPLSASPGEARACAGAESEEVFALGGWLAKQRQLRGIRLEELAALTRLPVRSLERLEAGVFDGQQDGFVRGFVRTVAVAIGLDPEDAVARLLAEPDARPGSRLPDLRRLAVAAVGLAGVLALVLALWEVARAPAASEGQGSAALLVRRDAVRALAIERGLLSEEPATAGPPAVLLPEPLPEPAAEGAAPDVGADVGRDRPLGSSAPPAAQASPD
jgi:hypothetical protein